MSQNDSRTQDPPGPGNKEPAEGGRQTVERELDRSGQGGGQGGAHPENREGADKATADNDLTTGHSAPDDGGADNARR